MQIKTLCPKWQEVLKDELGKDYMKELNSFVKSERAKGRVFPASEDIFSALNLVEPKSVKVVIIGQDPYHGAGQAHGLSFSVRKGIELPPSLQNIFKEIESDVGIKNKCGELTPVAKQGVLFLNTVLTVREAQAGSHRNRGWEVFTETIVRYINENCDNVVFMLWGGFAKAFANMINNKKHLVLLSVHPSPLSAYGGFFGCKHFSKANEYLKSKNKEPIEWRTGV